MSVYSEAEAKTKWCPYARVIPGQLRAGTMHPVPDIPAHNRVQEIQEAVLEATWHLYALHL